CQRAWPTAATLDGQLPWIQAGDEGYLVEVDQPGPHQASLEIVLPVTSKKTESGADQALELELPHSAITTLEQIDLPPGLTEIKVGNYPVRLQESERNRIANLPIGSVDRFQITWRGQTTQTAKGPPVTAATGHVVARVDQTNVITDAELVLQVLRG